MKESNDPIHCRYFMRPNSSYEPRCLRVTKPPPSADIALVLSLSNSILCAKQAQNLLKLILNEECQTETSYINIDKPAFRIFWDINSAINSIRSFRQFCIKMKKGEYLIFCSSATRFISVNKNSEMLGKYYLLQDEDAGTS